MRISISNALTPAFAANADIDLDASALQRAQTITDYFTDATTTTHLFLKQEAETTILTHTDTLEDYIARHRAIRTRMQMANYPNSRSVESVTVQFIIQGLSTHTTYKHLQDTWSEAGTIPIPIQGLVQRLQAVHARTIERKSATMARTPRHATNNHPPSHAGIPAMHKKTATQRRIVQGHKTSASLERPCTTHGDMHAPVAPANPRTTTPQYPRGKTRTTRKAAKGNAPIITHEIDDDEHKHSQSDDTYYPQIEVRNSHSTQKHTPCNKLFSQRSILSSPQQDWYLPRPF